MGPIETAHDRPWATVLRVPVADGVVWFKACAPVQAFEPRLTDRALRALSRPRRRGPRLRRGARVAPPRRRRHADRRLRQPTGDMAHGVAALRRDAARR